MPFNGNNVFTIVNTFVPGTTILSSAVNANFSDIATGLSDCVTRDAQGAVTGNLIFSSTGFLQLPNGTTGQRPGSASSGYLRFNTTTNDVEFYNGTSWLGTVPVGGLIPYTGSTAPNSSFVIPVGQAISRTTFATYFSLVSTTYGIGDGSTTFNVPDLRGRVPFQVDSGGSGRITAAGGNFDGTVLGNSGGGQNKVIANSNLPASIPFTDPGHIHSTNVSNTSGNTNTPSGAQPGNPPGGSAGNIYQNPGQSNASFASNFIVSATTGITINAGGANTALPTLNPCIMINYILRVL